MRITPPILEMGLPLYYILSSKIKRLDSMKNVAIGLQNWETLKNFEINEQNLKKLQKYQSNAFTSNKWDFHSTIFPGFETPRMERRTAVITKQPKFGLWNQKILQDFQRNLQNMMKNGKILEKDYQC